MVVGNFIGTDASHANRGSSGTGIFIRTSLSPATGNTVGGATAESENEISNVAHPIQMGDDGDDDNLIARNRGQGNSGAFIDLGSTGPGNGANGPNDGAEAPAIISATTESAAGSAPAPVASEIRVFRTSSPAGPGATDITAFVGGATVTAAGSWSLDFDSPVPPDERLVATVSKPSVMATGFRNTSELSSAVAPTDVTEPDTAITEGPSGTTTDPTPTFSFSSEPGAGFECALDGDGFAACSSPHTTAPLANGSHTFAVRAKDPAGNVDPSPATRDFTVDAPPGSPGPPAPPVGPSDAELRTSLSANLATVTRCLKRGRIRGLVRKRGVSCLLTSLMAGNFRLTGSANTTGSARRITALSGRKSFAGAGKGRMKARATRRGRAYLRQRRRARFTLMLSFAAQDGRKVSARRRVTIRR